MSSRLVGLILAAAIAAAAQGSAAIAAPAARVWVSGHGVDQAGCGAPTAPCRSLQYAHDSIAAGGEIDILDPAGYGSVAITKAISIVNDGVGTAGIQSTHITPGIAIEAGANDAVYLRGLNLDGLGSAFNGILFFSARSVTITNCTFRHYLDQALELSPATGFSRMLISNSLIADNSGPAIAYEPSDGDGAINLVLDRVSMFSRQGGLTSQVGGGATGTFNVTIVNSIGGKLTDCAVLLNSMGGQLTAIDRRSTMTAQAYASRVTAWLISIARR